MNRARLVLSVLTFAIVLPAAVLSLPRPALAGDDVTLSGEVIDMACYVAHDAKGPDHKKCAQKCAQMGQPLGLLTADGKAYILVAVHADQAPYEKVRKLAGEKVTIKGETDSKDGMTTLSVKEVK